MSDVRNFGAAGDGQNDDTEAVEHTIAQGEGPVEFPPGTYLLRRTVRVDLAKTGRLAITGAAGTPKIIMAGEGPAFHIVGTHDKNADPAGFSHDVWRKERMPTVSNLEIEGTTEKAGGILIDGVMQPTFTGVLIRKVNHAIHVRRRCRNVLISHCHLYNNHGIGVYFDDLNLHQAIIIGSHISYCLQGGIVIRGSEIRNLHITGNDIEYNFDVNAPTSADLLIDCRKAGSSVREVTIVSNTIQAKYSPGGANVRLLGLNRDNNRKVGIIALANNVLGSEEVNLHIADCRGITVTGNTLYSGHRGNMLIEGSQNITVTGNSFDHNSDYGDKELCTGVKIKESQDVLFGNNIVQDALAGKNTVLDAVDAQREALVQLTDCDRATVSGCQILDGQPYALLVEKSNRVNVSGSTIVETRTDKMMRAAVCFRGAGRANFVSGNTLGRGLDEALVADAESNVKRGDNLIDESKT
ncbi:MAG: right-handed parallel beta-helix repeat-containing protein [Planctomycetes bacterium]|nr:right-handed parallel beta-helix repeat-containing protein [Planctomycetota bacterium]